MERLKRGIIHARGLVQECLAKMEWNTSTQDPGLRSGCSGEAKPQGFSAPATVEKPSLFSLSLQSSSVFSLHTKPLDPGTATPKGARSHSSKCNFPHPSGLTPDATVALLQHQ
ncbi:hypothetical protein QTO34_017054 [Cnephaeus nilssonii]|uniref:Uncharacterized protein n=1 Tax=Cnephaeus nilssonii TaxID=3371016 RepID=A0AA40LR45_CNENI|nr:hypothetical protein QTO34_017054 [Eptesicus nilssonii]